jgi:hypothetical protein
MNVFKALEIAAWAASAAFTIWLVIDLVRTNMRYSESTLMSSREGEIEDELVIDPTHRGAA